MSPERQLEGFADLTWQELEEWAGSTIVSRGKSYKKRVLNLRSTPECGLVATVSGTDSYTTRVDFTEDGDLSCSCTCPYDWGPCKHAVAVVLAALDALKQKRAIPVVGSEDDWSPKHRAVAAGVQAGEESEVECDRLPEDDDFLYVPPRRDRRKPSVTDRDIRAYVSKMPKSELRELLLQLAEAVPEARARIGDRIRLEKGDAGGVARTVREVRSQIEALAAEPAWVDSWSGSGHVPEYSGVVERLEMLLAAGHADEVVSLGEDLLRLGNGQIEMSNDEGELGMEIGECMDVVVRAVAESSMTRAEQLLWEIDAGLQDEYGILENAESLNAYAELYSPEAWSTVADTLVARLQESPEAPAGSDGARYLRDYRRQHLMREAVRALDNAGRRAEIAALLEREVAVARCYTDLVDHLLAVGRLDDARRWATVGYKDTIGNLRGIASELQERLRKMAEHMGDVKLVAAHRAFEFFCEQDVSSYAAFQQTAEAAGVWTAVRPVALRFLETGEPPRKVTESGAKKKRGPGKPTYSEWPLPSTGLALPEYALSRASFPHHEALVEIAILEQRNDDVVSLFERAGGARRAGVWGLGDKVAAAVKGTHPEVSLAIWRQEAERLIAEVRPSAYLKAGTHLCRVARLFHDMGRAEEWRAYLAELRAANKRRPRMMEVLGSIEHRRRRIVDD